MPDIPESYASPGLRWSLLLHDHPGAKYTAELKPGAEIGIPPQFGGGGNLCVVTITFPEDDLEDVIGYKPVRERGTPDDWNQTVTKTLGRALKKAGYPDDLNDLRALMLWRRRTKELDALAAGQPVAALTEGDVAAALPAGRGADEVTGDDAPDDHPVRGDDRPDHHVAQGDDAPDPHDPPTIDAEVIEPPAPAPQAAPAPAAAPQAVAPAPAPQPAAAPQGSGAWAMLPPEMGERVNALPEREQGQLVSQLDKWNIGPGHQLTAGETRKVNAYLQSLEATAKAPSKGPRAKPAEQAPALAPATEAPAPEPGGFVSDDLVEELLNAYEGLTPHEVSRVDAEAEKQGLTWNFPMPQGTYNALHALILGETGAVAA